MNKQQGNSLSIVLIIIMIASVMMLKTLSNSIHQQKLNQLFYQETTDEKFY
jgi:competence protein ComGC